MTKTDFTCEYCTKTFKRERTLESHACEPRRRWKTRNETGVQIGYETFKLFYRSCQGHSPNDKTFQEFAKSAYYTAFVSFGNYCISVHVFAPARFAEYLIKQGIKVDAWATDTAYTKFLIYFLPLESVEDALTRSIEYAIEWGKEKDMNYSDLFRYGNPNRICQALMDGKISPWALYTSKSGASFLGSTITEWHHEGIWEIIDVDAWEKVLAERINDVDFAKRTLKLGGW